MLKLEVVQAAVAPGAVAAVEARVGSVWRAGCGWFGQLGTGEAVAGSTLYDLASLTKPMVACVLARLVQRRLVAPGEPLSELLPATLGTPSGPLPLELFACHRAGLCAHLDLSPTQASPLPARARCISALEQAALARRPECPGFAPSGGFAPLYSDLGFILLGAALEARMGEPLDALVRREVTVPLGLEIDSARGWGRRLGESRFVQRVAPTEELAHRGGLIRGEVHDDNAHSLAGLGAAGHAGLFGTAEAVARFGVAMLGSVDGWLSESARGLLLRRRPGGPMRLGFDGLSGAHSSAGNGFHASTFGHLGFTGTSFWCDPRARCAVALLTNRVFPSRENVRIRAARPAVHSQLRALALEGVI